jgi:formylglycine-generating enzyme required for sulfatase activity
MINENIEITKRKINDMTFNMIYCHSGEFFMGKDSFMNRFSLLSWLTPNHSPKHKVKINQGFWIGETQVTQELWQSVMGTNPSFFKTNDQFAVESVSWYDCLDFCNQLSEREGFLPCFQLSDIIKKNGSIKKAYVEWNKNANGYRLPTEAEWEYAAKAGTEFIYSGSNDIKDVAWHIDEDYTPHEVKTKKANSWGLYDMSGNVFEYCMDAFKSNAYKMTKDMENPIVWQNDHCARVIRGGCFLIGQSLNDSNPDVILFNSHYQSVNHRNKRKFISIHHRQGFRLLRSEH